MVSYDLSVNLGCIVSIGLISFIMLIWDLVLVCCFCLVISVYLPFVFNNELSILLIVHYFSKELGFYIKF